MQQPRVLHRPAWTSERCADEAIALTAACGQQLDEFQDVAVRAILAESYPAKWAATEAGILIARQNGKGGILEAIALWSLFIGGGQTLWTAHQFKTAHEAYLRVKGLIEANAELSALVVRWDGGGSGEHLIELSTGARLHFIARSMNSGRGFSPRLLIIDEAQELSALALQALLFATSAQKGRQIIFTGTVPAPENDSTVWTSVRDRGRAGTSPRLAWLEWTPDGSDDPVSAARIDRTDPLVRAQANPALTIRIEPETIDDEWEASQADPAGFDRERLSIWPSAVKGSGVIDLDLWGACKVDELAPLTSPLVLAVEVEQDRSAAVLVLVGTRPDGLAQVEVVDGGPKSGTSWVARRMAEVVAGAPECGEVVVDGRAQAAPLVEDIRQAITEALEDTGREVMVTVATWADEMQACAQVFDAIRDAALRHGGGPVLLEAVRGAQWKVLESGGRVWSRSKSTKPAELYAMTLGHWAWKRGEAPYNPMDGIA